MSARTALSTLLALSLLATVAGRPGPELSDPEVAHAAVTANAIDVELARLALERAQSPRVQQFAQTMIDVHTAVNEQAAALAQKLGVTPQENELSRSLREGAARTRSRLEQLSGAAFDRAYIEHEIAYHRAVIETVEGVLLPETENAQLKELLQNILPALDGHLRQARQVAGSLEHA